VSDGCFQWPAAAPYDDSSMPTDFAWLVVRLVAAFAPETGRDAPAARSLAIEESILSLCRAVIGVGGTITLDADTDVAPFVAEIAAEYPGDGRVLVTYVEDTPVLKELNWLPGVTLLPRGHDAARPVATVVIGDANPEGGPAETVVVGGTRPSRQPYGRDVVAEALGPSWSEYALEELPYPYVMEHFVEELGRRPR
jgi:hypothetical protein